MKNKKKEMIGKLAYQWHKLSAIFHGDEKKSELWVELGEKDERK